MSTVAAVIPTWNRADLVRSVLANLHSQTRVPDQVIVLDNGSTDDTVSVASEMGARCIALGANRGFAVAVNEGILRANSDWILILNNDVALQSRLARSSSLYRRIEPRRFRRWQAPPVRPTSSARRQLGPRLPRCLCLALWLRAPRWRHLVQLPPDFPRAYDCRSVSSQRF